MSESCHNVWVMSRYRSDSQLHHIWKEYLIRVMFELCHDVSLCPSAVDGWVTWRCRSHVTMSESWHDVGVILRYRSGLDCFWQVYQTQVMSESSCDVSLYPSAVYVWVMSCIRASFHTKSPAIYVYIHIYIYVFTHTRTHTHVYKSWITGLLFYLKKEAYSATFCCWDSHSTHKAFLWGKRMKSIGVWGSI